jgi:hypothetical protein
MFMVEAFGDTLEEVYVSEQKQPTLGVILTARACAAFSSGVASGSKVNAAL